jgi:hypothetical protein
LGGLRFSRPYRCPRVLRLRAILLTVPLYVFVLSALLFVLWLTLIVLAYVLIPATLPLW